MNREMKLLKLSIRLKEAGNKAIAEQKTERYETITRRFDRVLQIARNDLHFINLEPINQKIH